MRQGYSNYTVDDLCRLFGCSRQAYYKNRQHVYRAGCCEELVLQLVQEVRRDFPRMGSRKLLCKLRPKMETMGITIGRDSFCDLMAENHLSVRRVRNGRRTTNSYHHFHKYPNLIKGYEPTEPNQLWVSDITYVNVGKRFGYLSLVTDAYSHKIVGWSLSKTLAADSPLRALECALRGLPPQAGPIHHSDRGIQYCCADYVERLTDAGMAISMTESGDPRDNAIAERVNGILKTEWLNESLPEGWRSAERYIGQVIELYNNERPHQSIGYQTPETVHATSIKVKRMWKNYYKRRQGNEIITTLPTISSATGTNVNINNFVNPIPDDIIQCKPRAGIKL